MKSIVTAKLILHWAVSTFGPVALNPRERAKRMFEECCEVMQSEGIRVDELTPIMERTYSRPVGESWREVGGLLVTVYGYCAVRDMDPDAALATEVLRCLSKDPNIWRLKHEEKVAAGTAERG